MKEEQRIGEHEGFPVLDDGRFQPNPKWEEPTTQDMAILRERPRNIRGQLQVFDKLNRKWIYRFSVDVCEGLVGGFYSLFDDQGNGPPKIPFFELPISEQQRIQEEQKAEAGGELVRRPRDISGRIFIFDVAAKAWIRRHPLNCAEGLRVGSLSLFSPSGGPPPEIPENQRMTPTPKTETQTERE